MATNQNKNTISCPDCSEEISLVLPVDKGDRYTCPNCWADLIVVNLDPIELHWNDVDDDDEDWDDD